MLLSGQGGTGILGGTFDPVHTGHLILAQEAMEKLDLSRILFIPCNQPPHKSAVRLTAARHRLAMLEMAIEGNPAFEASDIEIRRGGVSYAVDTLRALSGQAQSPENVFIIGADTLPELHLWHEIETVLTLCRFAAFGRPGYIENFREENINLPPPWPERLMGDLHPGRLIEISSSDIRHRLAEGWGIRYLVPPEVEMYIAEHNLYAS